MISSREVHFTIQQMNNNLSGHDDAIAVDEIAGKLNISLEELLPHLHTLCNMYYICFTDRKCKKIKLTFAGTYSIVPGFIAKLFPSNPVKKSPAGTI